jgi:hypothetical protein
MSSVGEPNQPAAQRTVWPNDLGAGVLLLLLILGFFWRTLSGDVYQPADGGDLISFIYPTYRFAASQLSQGVLPLWNPHLYGGAPFISDIQAGFLYPPNLLLFWLRPTFAYTTLQWLAIGHLYWAGLGMYILLRTWRWREKRSISRPAALLGGLAFALSDPLLIHLGNLNLIAVLSWLPWVLAAYQRALTQRALRWAGLAALLFAVGNYAGHAQSSLYIGLAVGLYTLLWLAAELTEWPGVSAWSKGRILIRRLAPLGWLIGLTFLLTAPILLPALELPQYTARHQFAYQDTVHYSLAPTQLIGLLTPGFFGHGPALHWSLWERVETPYAGVITLILALAALLTVGEAGRRRLWPWLGVAGFGLITALGIYAILHGWLTLLLPGFGQLRAPARALVLWTLGLSILAAVGADHLSAQDDDPAKTPFIWPASLQACLQSVGLILTGVFTPLLYLALLLTQQEPTAFLRASLAALAVTLAAGYWLAGWALLRARQAGWLGANVFVVLLLLLLFLDLSSTSAYTDISPTDPTRGYQHPEMINFLKNDPDLFRIDSNTGIEGLWQPNSAALHGLQDVQGVANPLVLRHWQALNEATGGRHSRLYDLLNVKYVVVQDGAPLPEGKYELALDAPGELAVYRNRTALPRAWLVHQVEAASPSDSFDQLRTASDFDPQQLAYLTPIADAPLPSLAPATGDEQVEITRYSGNALTLQVQASAPALLLLSEVWYPGWRAAVNGVTSTVWQTNGALRGVVVPAGASTVELWFAPPRWWMGLIGFGLGLLGLAWLWLRRW